MDFLTHQKSIRITSPSVVYLTQQKANIPKRKMSTMAKRKSSWKKKQKYSHLIKSEIFDVMVEFQNAILQIKSLKNHIDYPHLGSVIGGGGGGVFGLSIRVLVSSIFTGMTGSILQKVHHI